MTEQHDPNSKTQRQGAAAETVTPESLAIKRAEQELRVTWKDGRQSVYPAYRLRKTCPCATCRTERERDTGTLLPILKTSPDEIKLAGAKLVGSYAIQLFWSDGHDAGIYDFKYLRSLDNNETPG